MPQPTLTIEHITTFWRYLQPSSSPEFVGGGPHGLPSYFDLQVSGNSSYMGLGWLDGWCINPDLNLHAQDSAYTGVLYSSYELDVIPVGLFGTPPQDAMAKSNLDLVNWVLNQHFAENSNPDYASYDFNYGEVQSAIWKLLGYPDIPVADTINSDLDADGPVSPTDILAIYTAAQTHDGYVPDINEYIGVIVDMGTDDEGNPRQPIIIEVHPAKLGDFVWEDLNANGLQDSGEAGIQGVKVNLVRDIDSNGTIAAHEILATTSTDANGFYAFKGLTPGLAYQVQFAPDGLPAGFDAMSPRQADGDPLSAANSDGSLSDPVVLAAGEFNSTLDAGFFKHAALGNFVWMDRDRDGIQDATEAGVDGLTVQLLNGIGSVIATTTTGDDPTTAGVQHGYYAFTGLNPGQYQVQFSKPIGASYTSQDAGSNDAVDSDANIATGRSQLVTVASGETNTTIDAGLTGPCIGVNFNFSGNTALDGPDGNIRTFADSGLAVNVSAFSRTKAAGAWDVAYLGSYSGGLGVTDKGETGANNTHAVDNTGGRDNYVLFEFSQAVVLDRAFLGYVSGDSDIRVWIGNINNAFTSHVMLSDTVLGGMGFTELNTTTMTAARWADLNAGEFSGNVIVIAADTTGTPNDYFKLQNLDVCYCADIDATAAIGDAVWQDANGNGIRDAGENGISGVTVRLIGASVDGLFNTADDRTLATTTTDVDGKYLFNGVTPGQYQVAFGAPSGHVFTARDVGANDGVDSDADRSTGRSQAFTVLSGQTNYTVDAGLYQTAALGNFVWNDLNLNGIQDAGEPGINGLTVKLLNGSGAVIGTTVTGDDPSTTTAVESGYYSFTGLAPGQYQVQFSKPAGYAFTKSDVGLDGSDSDAAILTGKSQTVTLTSGQINSSVDAGVYAQAKFFVVDSASDSTFKYASNGQSIGNFALQAGDLSPRGATANIDGSKLWVLDSNKYVYLYKADGSASGVWKANDAGTSPQGIAVDGQDMWVVDSGTRKMYWYDNGALLTSGTANPNKTFSLDAAITNPKGIATDGTYLWVVNDATTDKVYRYTIQEDSSGNATGLSSLVSWKLATTNATPTGLTIDPTGASKSIWVVDDGTNQVFEYANARSLTSGSGPTPTKFNLASGNGSPQDIADPRVFMDSGLAQDHNGSRAMDSLLISDVLSSMNDPQSAQHETLPIPVFEAHLAMTLIGSPSHVEWAAA